MTIFTEAIKLKDGVFSNINYHQARVDQTLRAFYQTKIDLSTVSDMIPDHMKAGMFKCRILYSDRIEKVEFLPYSIRNIQKVGVMVDDAIDYSYKYADRTRLNALLQKSGCDEIIIVRKGLVTDAYSANLVFQSSQGLFTPQNNLLPGTKRRQLIDRGISTERSIRVEEIKTFDSVYFINAMIDLEDEIKVPTAALVYL